MQESLSTGSSRIWRMVKKNGEGIYCENFRVDKQKKVHDGIIRCWSWQLKMCLSVQITPIFFHIDNLHILYFFGSLFVISVISRIAKCDRWFLNNILVFIFRFFGVRLEHLCISSVQKTKTKNEITLFITVLFPCYEINRNRSREVWKQSDEMFVMVLSVTEYCYLRTISHKRNYRFTSETIIQFYKFVFESCSSRKTFLEPESTYWVQYTFIWDISEWLLK